MKLSLVSDDGNSMINFDFTKFFSEEGYWTVSENYRNIFVKRPRSRYKQMIKNLVSVYISKYEFGIYSSPVDVVDMLFKQALEEKLKAPQKELLQKNYDMFRKMYRKELAE